MSLNRTVEFRLILFKTVIKFGKTLSIEDVVCLSKNASLSGTAPLFDASRLIYYVSDAFVFKVTRNVPLVLTVEHGANRWHLSSFQ